MVKVSGSVRYCGSFLLQSLAGHRSDALEKNGSHLTRQFRGIAIDPRVIPGVDPVNHAKQAEHGCPAGKLQSTRQLIAVQQFNADSVIFTLDGCDLGSETVLQDIILVR